MDSLKGFRAWLLIASVTAIPGCKPAKISPTENAAAAEPELPPVSVEGTYATNSEDLNSKLTLHEDHSFRYEVSGCLGNTMVASGTFRIHRRCLVLHLERISPTEGVISLRYCIVTWGERIYLVGPAHLDAFLALSKSPNRDASLGLFLLKETNGPRPALGEPQIVDSCDDPDER